MNIKDHLYKLIICVSLLLSIPNFAQELVIDDEGFETFEMTEADTSYTMKKYFMAFLKKGPNRDHGPEEAAVIQKGHLAHMDSLAHLNKIAIAGPFGDDGEVRGIVIYNEPDEEKVKAYVANDPAVKAGRLTLELHPFWAAKGSKLP